MVRYLKRLWQYRQNEQCIQSCCIASNGALWNLVAALKACGSLVDIEIGKAIHSNAIERGECLDIYVATTLVAMYAKCGSLGDARAVFNRMPCHSLVSWNALLLGYAEHGEGAAALELFSGMPLEDAEPNARTFVAAVKACACLAKAEEGREVDGVFVKLVSLEKGIDVHSQAANRGCDMEIYVATALVDLYAKCGSLLDARRVFDRMAWYNTVLWNALILGYAENKQAQLALELFRCMGQEGCAADAATFVAALKACTRLALKEDGSHLNGMVVKLKSLEQGMAVHSQAAANRVDTELQVANTLLDMYANCGSMVDARSVFDRMPFHNVVSWNALLLGYATNGDAEMALTIFPHMSCAAEARTYVAVLKAITSLTADRDGEISRGALLEKGRCFHSQAAVSGYDSDIFLTNTLVDMYSKCGSLEDARRLFDSMPRRNVVSWNVLMLGYVESRQGDLALELFNEMQAQGCAPDALTFVAALKACIELAAKENGVMVDGKHAKLVALERVMDIHARAAKGELQLGTSVINMLVTAYGKCGSLIDSQTVFDRMQQPDVVSWNALILAYSENEEEELALEIFGCMPSRGFEPDGRSIVAAVKACTCIAAKEQGKQISGKLVKVVSLENGYALHCQAAKEGVEFDSFVVSSLVDMYSKCGSMVDARKVFDSTRHQDLVLWNVLIAGYVENGEGELALDAFESMQKLGFVKPDAKTYSAALKACGSMSSLGPGKTIHAAICRRNDVVEKDDPVMDVSLVDFYARCGSLVNAQLVFDSASTRRMEAWNALMAGYSCQGDLNQVLDLFQCMKVEGLQVNDITLLSILTACRHAGALEQGRRCFEAMQVRFGCSPRIEHYHCVIDLLGRANRIDEMVKMVKSMPFEASEVTWTIVLAACSKWRNRSIGKLAFDALVGLKSADDGAGYILMANTYL